MSQKFCVRENKRVISSVCTSCRSETSEKNKNTQINISSQKFQYRMHVIMLEKIRGLAHVSLYQAHVEKVLSELTREILNSNQKHKR